MRRPETCPQVSARPPFALESMNYIPAPPRSLKPTAMALLSLFSMASTVAQQASPPAPAEATPAGPATGAVVPQTLREVKVESELDKSSFGPNAESISRLPAELRDIPQSITIINQALMQSQ